jgi:FAD-dependent urate hydroxylase
MVFDDTDRAAMTSVVHPLGSVSSRNRQSEGFDVLVLDAASRQSLAAVRSLGKAGLRVATAECFAECDPALPPLAFRSRYSRHNLVLPSFASDADEFAAAVEAFIRRNPTRVVLPASDGSIAALIGWRPQLEALGTRLALPSGGSLAAANNKDRTLLEARRLGIPYPTTVCCNDLADLSEALEKVGFPAVLKPTISWAPQTVERLQAVEVLNKAEAEKAARRFLGAGASVIVQLWVGGRREGVTLLVQGGEVRASIAVVAHRTIPALGGASVLRESVPVAPDLYDPSVRLVKALGLDGPCEVEYRRDETGCPLLMEINARLAGPLETLLRSGFDLPLMVWRWAAGLPVATAGDFQTVRTRWLRGDLRWLRDNFYRVGRPDSVSRYRHDRVPKEAGVEIDDVLVIGAGPFGLSISAHLTHLGIGHRIVGRPMDTWLQHMPAGMYLKSEPYASDMASPESGYDVEAFCRLRGIDYEARVGPLSLERFSDYARWYTASLVPDVIVDFVTRISTADEGFHVEFAEGPSRVARNVIVATGLLHHTVVPAALDATPVELISHSSDHDRLDQFAGRRVAVIGAGQSALETAALLHESGAHPVLVVRRAAISFVDPNPAHLSRLGRIRRPVTKLCEGWHCAFWASPSAFRRLPLDMRVKKARSVLGPAGAWWLKDRVDGVVETLAGHQVQGAVAHGSGVRLVLDGPQASMLDVDHIVAATGFRVDIGRLAFLPKPLLARVVTLDGFPLVTRAGQSTVPGLYFVGAAAAASLGPSTRFIAGTHTGVRQLVRSLARSLRVRDRHIAESVTS